MTDKRKNLTVIDGNQGVAKLQELFPTFANLDLTAEQINALKRHERKDLLSRLDYRKKYQLLQLSDDMVRLVHDMPAEDLYYTIESAGRTDALDLVMAATPEQLTHIFDITCWENDQFDPTEMLEWLSYLIQFDPERAMGKIRTIDPELLVTMLSAFILVRRFDWHDLTSYIHDDSYFSLDDFYLFELIDPESPYGDQLVVLLQMLYRFNFKLYSWLMETMLWEMPSNVEELAYRSHTDRMLDHGYQEYLDALTVFSPLDPDSYKSKVTNRKAASVKESVQRLDSLPTFYRHLLDSELFLSRVLESINPDSREQLRTELVFLANRMLVARKSLKEFEKVRDTLGETQAMLSLGLELLADGAEAEATALLLTTPLLDIFRLGYSLALRLRSRAKAFHEKYIAPHGRKMMALISSPSREVMTALMQSPPHYHSAADPDGGHLMRPFARMAEIDRAQTLIVRIEFLFDLHFRLLAIDPAQIAAGPANIGIDPLDPDMRFVKLFLTVAANALLGHEANYEPLETDDFEAYLERVLVKREETGYAIRLTAIDETTEWLKAYTQHETDNYLQLAGMWVQRAFAVMDKLAEDLAGLTRKEAISLSQVLALK